jgi:hypothetical protein
MRTTHSQTPNISMDTPSDLLHSFQGFLDDTLSSLPLSERITLPHAFSLSASPPSQTDLRKLDNLPVELQLMILSHSTVSTLFALRRVNKRGKVIVDALPEFKNLLTHSPSLLRGAVAVGSADWLTTKDLYSVLYTRECAQLLSTGERCGMLGHYVDLLAAERRCHHCVHDDGAAPFHCGLTAAEAFLKWGLAKGSLENVRTYMYWGVISADDGAKAKLVPMMRLCVRRDLYDAAVDEYGSAEAVKQQTLQRLPRHNNTHYWGSCGFAYQFRNHHLRGPTAVQRMQMTSVIVPWMLPRNRRPQWGVYCRVCCMREHWLADSMSATARGPGEEHRWLDCCKRIFSSLGILKAGNLYRRSEFGVKGEVGTSTSEYVWRSTPAAIS